MRVFLDSIYNSFELNTDNNIIFVYGENDTGKTMLLENIFSKGQSKIYNLVDNLDFDDNKNIVQISEDFDLHKELSLMKTSKLYKIIFKDLKSLLDLNDFDIHTEIESNSEVRNVIEFLNKHLEIESGQFKIDAYLDFVSNFQFFEHNLKLRLLNENDEEINVKMLSKSKTFKIYFDILKNTKYNNQIILLDCPETFLDYKNRKILIQSIKDLSKNNLVIITIRDINFLKFSSELIKCENIYKISNFNLNKIEIKQQDLIDFFNKSVGDRNYDFYDLDKSDIEDIKKEFLISNLDLLLN